VLLRLVFALIAMAPVLASAQEPVATLPYRIDYGGWFTVSATVNGQGPYDFIIDTGATQSLVFENLAAVQTFAPSGGPPQQVLGLLSAGSFPTFTIGDVAVGATRLSGLVSVVLPDWRVGDRSPQGLIGLDFLSLYTAKFDRATATVSFYPAGTTVKPAAGWKSASLKGETFGLSVGKVYTVDAFLDNSRVRFLLDLGASGTIINSVAKTSVKNRGVGIVQRGSGADAASRIRDALDTREDAKSVVVRNFALSSVHWYRKLLVVNDAPIFRDLGVHRIAFGLFGADLLVDRSFILDFANGNLLLGPRVKQSPARG
jgi:hypothetical protein